MKAKKSQIKIADLARRITGFSTPIGGVSWKPPAADRIADYETRS